jgi:NADH-quinone oxidoreductase subunit N
MFRLLLAFASSPGAASVGSVLSGTLGITLASLAIATMTIGNLGAYRQTSLKRLLAYSTVAHAGYLLAGVAALSRDAAAAVLYYLVAYLLANLAAFAAVAGLPSDRLEDARGLLRRHPLLGCGLVFAILGLLGLPPFAGFAGKLQVFLAAYRAPGLGVFGPLLLAAGVLNTALSAGYYLRVLRVVGLDDPDTDEQGQVRPLAAPRGLGAFVLLLGLLALAAGLAWTPLTDAAAAAAGVK